GSLPWVGSYPPMYSAGCEAGITGSGFPHSDIPGSKPACGSPRLIAACHVLHRLLAPRHPPYALSSLTIKLTQSVNLVAATFRWPLSVSTPRFLRLHFSRGAITPFAGFRLRARCANRTVRLVPEYCAHRSVLVLV